MRDEVSTDPEVFQQCTDTIIRQVGDIGRMVDEFSSFARMPAPVMRRENAQELLQQAVFLQRVANPADRLRDRCAQGAGLFRMRRTAGRPGADQCAEECRRRRSRARIAKGDDDAGHASPSRWSRTARMFVSRHRQRHRPAAGTSPSADRALCHDARQGHGPGPGHRAQDHGRPWRRNASWPTRTSGRRRRSHLDLPACAEKPESVRKRK